MIDVSDLCSNIKTIMTKTPAGEALLVGVSGIDGSGKGYVTSKLAEQLRSSGVNVALINVDGWLNLPGVRFNRIDPGRHFYDNAFRFDEIFDQLVLPLKRGRSVERTADPVEETALAYHQFHYVFAYIDVILLEGIFIFKKSFVPHFDLRIWIDCPFDVALDRAVKRSQEGLSAEETIQAYETIYFPAQRIHADLDHPRSFADIVFSNYKND